MPARVLVAKPVVDRGERYAFLKTRLELRAIMVLRLVAAPEAAAVDGDDDRRRFLRVRQPDIHHGILVVAVLQIGVGRRRAFRCSPRFVLFFPSAFFCAFSSRSRNGSISLADSFPSPSRSA